MKLEDIAKQRELIAKLHTIVKELQQKAKIVKYAEAELNNLSHHLQKLK